jgi:type IV pilus assembly protein PilC
MTFRYKALDQTGASKEGTIDAINVDLAIAALQKRGLSIVSIKSEEESSTLLNKKFTFFDRVSNKDVVVLSRQMATLFSAQVSALRVFQLLAAHQKIQS